jgi:glycosyltransferase involved in cell wall biosynthesis
MEILVVGPETWSSIPPAFTPVPDGLPVSFLGAPKGLSKARNVGLKHAAGKVICFLDDDVLLDADFFGNAVDLLSRPDFADVGGITGYDFANYNQPIPLRWKLRFWLGTIPSLNPGDADHLGSNVPLAFLRPFAGWKEVKWLPGFCQIFPRRSINGLTYDEGTNAAEDRDFSMEVGRRWRLLICGQLHLVHDQDDEERMASAMGVRRAAFGLGRSFVKRSCSTQDYLKIAQIMIGEFVIDLVASLARPSWKNWQVIVLRLQGFFWGLTSLRRNWLT